MNKELSLLTEWAWSEGFFSAHRNCIEGLALYYQQLLQKRFPFGRGIKTLGLSTISLDIVKVLRVLSYGGRQPDSVPAARRIYLKSAMAPIVSLENETALYSMSGSKNPLK